MKEALKKLTETRTAAENEVCPNPRARAGFEMMRREAQAALPGARTEFDAAFKKVAFPMFLMGPGTETFLKFADEQAEIVVLDGVLSDLRASVRANINRNGEFAVSAYTAMIRELRQLGTKLGLTSIPAPEFQGEEYVSDDASLEALINRYLQKSVGPDFLAAIIEQEACRKAETLTGDQPVVPVIITGMGSEAASLGSRIFGKTPLLVTAPENVDAEFVTEQFKAIKSALKSNPKKK